MEDSSIIITVMFMLSLFSVLGTIGNSLVLYIYSHKKKKSTTRIFIYSLAGSDLLTCLFIMPFAATKEYLHHDLKYDVICKIYSFLVTCNIPFATFIMCVISIDRYFKICHPFWNVLNIDHAKVIVVCLFMFASTFGIVHAIAIGRVDLNSSNETTFTVNLTKMYEANYSSIDHHQDNASSYYTISRYGYCAQDHIHLSQEFVSAFDRVYAGMYLLLFIVVFVLYVLIFRSIHKQRAQMSKWKRSSLYPSEIANVETEFNAVTNEDPRNKHRVMNSLDDGKATDGGEECLPEVHQMRPQAKSNRHVMSINQNTLIADIRTIIMLFVVTIVFLIAFSPAALMSVNVVRYNAVIFNMCFIYNTTNPFIYTFMDKAFRDDIRKIIKCQSMSYER